MPGLAVGALLVAGAVVAYVLLSGSSRLPSNAAQPPSSSEASGTASSGTPITISDVQVWMNVTGRPEDNPNQTARTFDGNPATFWSTDQYTTPTFGGYYSGEGLAIHVDGTHPLHTLTVTTPTVGWAAQTYVANDLPTFGSPVSSWGTPTDSKSGISGSTTFDLKGRSGSWVLFWLTNLGPHLSAQVNEFRVT